MLVQRAFREGAAIQNSEKALIIGVLVGRVSEGINEDYLASVNELEEVMGTS
jgi:hypothetical protein